MFDAAAQFADRREAGRRLAAALAELEITDPLVLALPRGGVPVAFEVAAALHAPLDLLLVRKIGAPGHPEYGIGALVDGSPPQVVFNEEALRLLTPSAEYIEAETQHQLAELERRRKTYLGSRTALPPAGRTVILVDDGIATGGTVTAALKALRQANTKRIVLAVPVAPRDAIERLRQQADDLVCLAAPDHFRAVGLHYRRFDQTSDEEVVELLERARAAVPDAGGAAIPK